MRGKKAKTLRRFMKSVMPSVLAHDLRAADIKQVNIRQKFVEVPYGPVREDGARASRRYHFTTSTVVKPTRQMYRRLKRMSA